MSRFMNWLYCLFNGHLWNYQNIERKEVTLIPVCPWITIMYDYGTRECLYCNKKQNVKRKDANEDWVVVRE